MKQPVLAMTVTIGLLGSAMAYDPEPSASQTPTPTPTPITLGACNRSSWNTEVYRFYGARDPLLQSLSNIPAGLLKRRVFIQVTEGDSKAQIKLYEKQTDGTFTVTKWSGGKTAHLLAEIDRSIMENKGVNCIGEQVKAVLLRELEKGDATPGVAPPASNAAFSHSIKEAKGEFIQTTIIVLC